MATFERNINPYAECPVFETGHFQLRLIRQEDASDLLTCYGDPLARPFFNADNCWDAFEYGTIAEMEDSVGKWVHAYTQGWFIRWSIIDRQTDRAVGTVEMFSGDIGVLRVDVASAYEKQPLLQELFTLAVEQFPLLFNTKQMLTKVVPQATERLQAVENAGFSPVEVEDREYYWGHDA